MKLPFLANLHGTVQIGNYLDINGTDFELIIVGNNYIKGYSDTAKETFDESVLLNEAITDATGDYCIVATKNSNKIYMLNGSKKIWEDEVAGNILNVSVNKNGYSAIIYKQAGYKSSIKVINPEGKELFTSYLASTYAIDAKISNDNKKLAIAEIDAEGISVQSSIKIIDINNLGETGVSKVELLSGSLVTRIEFDNKNQLIVLTDQSALVYNGEVLNNFVELSNEEISLATIENSNNLITISRLENGIFDNNYELSVYEYKENNISEKKYEIEDVPSILVAKNKNIVMQVNGEIYVVNTNAKLIKKCKVDGNLKSIVLFNNGNVAALIFRDKIELLKI